MENEHFQMDTLNVLIWGTIGVFPNMAEFSGIICQKIFYSGSRLVTLINKQKQELELHNYHCRL